MLNVAIVGASGYTGLELIRILHCHPEVVVTCVTSERSAGKRISDVFPTLRGRCDLVLENLVKHRVPVGQEPENLIVLTDMAWDAACGSSQNSIYTGNSYSHNVKTAPWQSHIQMIRPTPNASPPPNAA